MATYAEFLAAHDRDERVLVWIEPRIVLTGWTLQSGSTYYVELAAQENGAAISGGLFRRCIGARENDTALTEQSSVATVDANAGSWWWDPTAGADGRLYVHTSTGADPDTFTTIQAVVRFHFATKPVRLEDGATSLYHHPWVAGGLPTLYERDDEDAIGAKLTRRSVLELINSAGWFNAIIAHDGDYRWRNARARFKLGGSYARGSQVLTLAQYADIATMAIADATAAEEFATFDLMPLAGILADQTLPSNPFFETDYPNLGDGVSGTHEWIGYGRAIIAGDLVDTVTSQGVWRFADGVTDAYRVWAVDRQDFSRTLLDPGSPFVEYLGNDSIQVLDSTYHWSTHWIEAEVQGRSASTNGLTFAHIARDILTRYMGVAASEIDTTSWVRANDLAPAELSVWIKKPRSVTSILTTAQEGFPSLERSVLGRVGQTAAGLWTFDIWRPSYEAEVLRTLRAPHFSRFRPVPAQRQPVTTVNVYYNARHRRDQSGGVAPEWDVETATDAAVGYENDISPKTLDVHTFLTRSRDAQILAQRLIRLAGPTRSEIEFAETGIESVGARVRDRVLVSYSPAPCVSGSYDRDVFEYNRLEHALGPVAGVQGRLTNLRGITRAGRWQPASAATYGSSTAFQRKHRGFWTNDSDEAAAGDAASKVSRWW